MIKLISIITAILVAFGATACVNGKNIPGEIKSSNNSDEKPVLYSDVVQADTEFSDVYNSLTAKLLSHTVDGTKNNLISPMSILLALSMTENGALGDTLAEFEAFAGMDIGTLNKYLSGYLASIPEKSDGFELESANSIWLRNGLDVKDAFLRANETYYGSQVYKSGFNDETVGLINAWVSEHTHKMIDKIIDSLSPESRMVLINAIAFESEWAKIYENSDVDDHIFNNFDGSESQIKLMRSNENMYIETDDSIGFVKNYKGGRFAFAALMPNEDVDFAEFVSTLDPETVSALVGTPEYIEVRAGLPEFKHECSYSLNEPLKKLGLENAFENTADFSGISETEPLKIGEVLHKTFIEVDKKGTKAAAVTAIIIECTSAMPVEREYKEVILDRPFVYAIIDRDANIPLFIGTVTNFN